MNITFLIGNGFDVGIGMKSRFKDFFPVYQEKSQNKSEVIKQLSENIQGDYDTWADFETALGEYTINFNKENKQNLIDQVDDFEAEFIEYLKEEEKSLMIEEDKEVGTIMNNALLKYYFAPNLAPESSAIIKSLYDTNASSSHLYQFVNFNYTFTLERCLGKIAEKIVCKRRVAGGERIDKIGKIVHVHGTCNLHPIIGVNDESQILNKELADDKFFTRFFVKPSLNVLLRQGNDTNATNVINQSKIICVYGMALGATDQKWWSLIINWLARDSQRQLIIFDYDEKYTPSTQFSWVKKEDSIIRKLEGYNSDSDINVENLRTRIHVAVHKNILSMNIPKKNKSDWEKILVEMIETEDK